ncbi:hypothetical protein RHEC894_PC00080 (plasmid) [Rhizobium sp. CIAT894]|uniref:DUF3991 and toprim domain-containing protein n=1 Tax=Rhizobium sp. CIAT894 TaxID=2020312 RepID=UPI000A1D6345|nr:DUF3991 and toprim domain-containing protein [Rhizobium sp. CIAT894]ARM91115.1 hypothetical protein RHEC894_PC00080 [Rhizobium sp. CIAT894]
MNRSELEELKDKVSCAAVLDKAGFVIDLKESTRRAVKCRRAGEIIIIIHEGKGWFDPLSDAKGDVFSLVKHLAGVSFADGLHHVADLIGYEPTFPQWQRPDRGVMPSPAVPARWRLRRPPWPGSLTWQYLTGERLLSFAAVRDAIRQDRLREGPYGSMWAAHVDNIGGVTGWEERGLDWRGFASGGAKVLFRLGQSDAARVCIAEAAIDAMSLAEIERRSADGPHLSTLYASTGGGWSPSTEAAIRELAGRPDTLLIAATDNNGQGNAYARRIRVIADEAGCGYERLRPVGDDWNEDLQASKRREGKREEGGLPHARRSRQG